MGRAGGVEIEAKLVVVGPGRQALLDELAERAELAGLDLGEVEHRELVDEYFDLPGQPLAARDSALRLRRLRVGGVERVLLTLKGPAQAATGLEVAREELESEWSPAALERVRAALASSGLPISPTAPEAGAKPSAALAAAGLSSIQLRATERRCARLSRGGTPVAELCLDRVRFRAGMRDVVHREVEVEAFPSTEAAEVSRIATALLAEYGGQLRAWRASKTAVGSALEELEEHGALASRLEGEELSEAGYDELRDRLRTGRIPPARSTPRPEAR